jgi:hypothetical protein
MPVLLLLLLAGPLCADTLSDLRGTLERLKGLEAVRGRLSIQSWSRNGEGKKSKEKRSGGEVQVEDGPQGLRLGWTATQIQAARKDAQAKAVNPDAATPNLETLKALDAVEATRLLGYAEHLSLLLQGAQLLEERADSYQGKPARLLVLKPEVRMSAEDKEVIKRFEVSLKLWLGADGVPVAMEEAQAYKGSKFLISFTGTRNENLTFGRVGNRLVALQCTRSSSGSGMGMTNESKTVTTLAIY